MVLMQELVKLKTFQLDIFYSYSISSQMLYKKPNESFLMHGGDTVHTVRLLCLDFKAMNEMQTVFLLIKKQHLRIFHF